MKVEKIEIKKELMEIDPGKRIVKFAKYGPLMASAEGETMNAPSREIEEYIVTTVREDGEDKNFLVKVDERKLFDELLKVRAGLIEKYVHEKTEYFRMESYWDVERYKNRIKSLPWWRRLFNLF